MSLYGENYYIDRGQYNIWLNDVYPKLYRWFRDSDENEFFVSRNIGITAWYYNEERRYIMDNEHLHDIWML